MSRWIVLLGLYLVQSIVTLCAAVQAIWSRWFLYLQLTPVNNTTPPPPKCIAIVLVDPVITQKDFKHLALVLKWCQSRQLQRVIVYDPRGTHHLLKHIQLDEVVQDFEWYTAHDCDGSAKHQQTLANHDDVIACNGQMTVCLISYKDALYDIVAAAQLQQQDLHCTECNQGEKPATAAWLKSKLQPRSASAAMQEPDLLLAFGSSFSLAGYPPWPIRVTEMYHMGQLAGASRQSLDSVFQRYSRTVQRFGS